jgi:hypothetical protein
MGLFKPDLPAKDRKIARVLERYFDALGLPCLLLRLLLPSLFTTVM